MHDQKLKTISRSMIWTLVAGLILMIACPAIHSILQDQGAFRDPDVAAFLTPLFSGLVNLGAILTGLSIIVFVATAALSKASQPQYTPYNPPAQQQAPQPQIPQTPQPPYAAPAGANAPWPPQSSPAPQAG